MAQLIPLGEIVTQGEKKTLEYLQKRLPDDWIIFSNVQITTGELTREIDAIVISDRCVWVIDEKGLAGTITGDEHTWVLADGSARERVLNNALHAAKMLKGKLVALEPQLSTIWVEGVVILSAPEVKLQVKDPRVPQHVCTLLEAERFFREVSCQGKILSLREKKLIQELIAGERVVARLQRRLEKIGHYQLVEKLATGTVIQTYRARREKFGEEFLLKLYDLSAVPEKTNRESWQKRVERECRILSKLRHLPGVVRIVESFQEVSGFGGNLWYLVMDLPSGPSLAARLAEPHWLAASRLLAARNLCKIVNDIHDAKVIHRQLSPANIHFFQTDHDLVLTGFELSRLPTSSLPPLDDLPASPYQAPEVTESLHNASEASDIYSLGVILWEIFSGTRPFGNRPRHDQDPDPLLTFFPEFTDLIQTADLEALLQLMLAYNPSDRLKNLTDVLTLFDEILGKKTLPETWPAMQLHPLPQGAQLGDYVVLNYLGAGGCFYAYRVARSVEDSQEYVAKVLRYPELLQMASHAFKALSLLDHDHIIKALEVRLLPDASYHLLEVYAPGKSCRDILSRQGQISALQVAKWGAALVDALVYMDTRHSPIYHGDISPSNIIIDQNQPYLIDFGLAYLGGSGPQGGVVGTAPYRPPERDLPNVPWPSSGDVYSLGIVLCELLFGELPYDCDGGTWHKSKIREELFSATTLASHELLMTLRRAIAPRPEERFPNAQEFQRALLQCPELQDKPIPHRQDRGIVPYLSEVIKVYNRGTCNAENRGLDSEFARATYVPTDLDHHLLTRILNREFALVILAGNPGDGKTAFLQQLAIRLGYPGNELPLNYWCIEHEGWTYECVLDGSAADSQRRLSCNGVLDALFDPLIKAGEIPRLAASLQRTQLLAINDGRLLEYIDEHQEHQNWLLNHLSRFFNPEMGQPHPDIILVDLNRRSLVSGTNQLDAFEEMLQALLSGGRGDVQLGDPWQTCKTCRAAPSCHVRFNVETLRHPVLGPQVKERLRTLLALVHSRGRLHITIRELRSMLAYSFFGDQTCEEIHQELEKTSLRETAEEFPLNAILQGQRKRLYFERIFNTGANGGRLLAELADLDPGLVDNPRLDRLLAASLKVPIHRASWWVAAEDRLPHRSLRWNSAQEGEDQTLSAFATLRRLLFFESRDLPENNTGTYHWLTMTPFQNFHRWLDNLVEYREGRYELPEALCRLICRGVSLTDNVPESLVDRFLAVRTSASPKTDLVVVRLFNLEDFHLTWERSETHALVLNPLPTAMLLQYGPQADPTLEISAELFELLVRVAEGYRLAAEELAGVAANLEIFKNRLLAMPAKEVCLLHPSLGSYRARQELHEGSRRIVLEAMP